ncbi:MAG: diguanylate cyclase [Dehalococcoidia bacterium]|jgi:diguanylate cyclase (GGDEF)-like protein|nr:diguanylate cyclase [Dehalococcoidia bacterium]
MNPNDEPGNTASSPNRLPFIITFALIAIGLAAGSVILPDLSAVFGVLAAVVAVVIAVLALGSENYLRRETELRQRDAAAAADEIERLSWQDRSTGLFSSSWFQQALEREVSRSVRYDQACVVIWLGLDQEHLRQQSAYAFNTDPAYIWRFVSDLTSAAVRDTDTVARWPGEYSVAILLPQSNAEGGNIVMDRLNERLETEKLEIADGTRTDVRFRHRVVSFPVDGSTAGELLAALQR